MWVPNLSNNNIIIHASEITTMPIVCIASQKLATNTVQINCASRDTLCPNTTILAWENRVRTGSFGKGSLPYFYSHSCDVPPEFSERISVERKTLTSPLRSMRNSYSFRSSLARLLSCLSFPLLTSSPPPSSPPLINMHFVVLSSYYNVGPSSQPPRRAWGRNSFC